MKKGDAHKKLERVRQLKKEIAGELYEMAELLRDFYDQELWRLIDLKDAHGEAKRPYASFDDFIDREGPVGRTMALELISVARAFPRETALEIGISRCYAMVMLARATPENDTARELLDRHPELREITVRDLEDRARRIREGTGTVEGETRDRAKLATELAAELQAVLRNRGAEGVLVQAHRKGEEWWLSIHILAEDVGKLRPPPK